MSSSDECVGDARSVKGCTHAQRARAMKLVSELEGYREHMTQDQEQRFMRALSRLGSTASFGSGAGGEDPDVASGDMLWVEADWEM